MSNDSKSEWVYWVQLDGDFARDYPTAEDAGRARLYEHGSIPPERRSIWRERTEVQYLYPMKGKSDE
jgi:hypothetical protein